MWSTSQTLFLENDKTIRTIRDIPHTLSYVIRKRKQIDSLMELPKDKRPPDDVLWHSNPDRLEEWLDDVLGRKNKDDDTFTIDTSMVEG